LRNLIYSEILNSDMKISCVVVAYNSSATIMKCLDSVFSQSYSDKEVFVVDNGSSDGIADIARPGIRK